MDPVWGVFLASYAGVLKKKGQIGFLTRAAVCENRPAIRAAELTAGTLTQGQHLDCFRAQNIGGQTDDSDLEPEAWVSNTHKSPPVRLESSPT